MVNLSGLLVRYANSMQNCAYTMLDVYKLIIYSMITELHDVWQLLNLREIYPIRRWVLNHLNGDLI